MNRRIMIVAGLLLLVFPPLSIPRQLHSLSVLREGAEVPAVVRSIPDNCRKRHLKVRLAWQDHEFSLRVGGDFCRTHRPGDTVRVLHSARYPELFVLPGRKKFFLMELISCIALSLLGLVILIRYLKPRRAPTLP